MLEHFPYDLLIIATHCGDSSGYRWTYEFTDSEGLHRTVVVDVAVGFQRTDDPEILKVGHFYRFVSVDGVDWADRAAKSKLYVGNVIHDFNERLSEGPSKFDPITTETVDRVVGSSAISRSRLGPPLRRGVNETMRQSVTAHQRLLARRGPIPSA